MSVSNRPTLPSNPGSVSGSSRRDNNGSSSSSRSERGSSRGGSHPAVESAVTRLLVSIKALLESLTQWSQLKVDENQVSDVYVRLGNDFNAAVAAFAAFNIDMAELLTVPDDLRNVLEQCLAEDATAENLEVYLPTVRQIITNLLQGLRGKQSIYRRIVSDHRHRSEQSADGRSDRDSRSSRSRREGSHRSQLSRSTVADDTPTRDSVSSRRSTPGRRREPASPPVNGGPGSGDFVGGFALLAEQHTGQDGPDAPLNGNSYQADSQSRKHHNLPPPIDPPPAESFQRQQQPNSLPNTAANDVSPVPQAVPASVKRYSLVDKPLSAPSVVVEPSSPDIDADQTQRNGSSPPAPPDTPPIDVLQAPAMANSLAALKKSDTLERRASKRFSTYNISKMTGTSVRERSARTGGGAGGNQQNRRSLAVSSALTPGELAVLTEVDDEEASPPPLLRRGSSRLRRTAGSRPSTPDDRQRAATPPVPPLPGTPSRTPEPTLPTVSEQSSVAAPADPTKITVFLQVGREVKKVTIEPGLSFASLRVLFVDRFSYNPGLENFPAIYIRDPSSGVQYELEDMEEVKEKCLLSLNIEPLDQIKQHIDAQISSLSQDLKELKSAVSNNNRQSLHAPNIVAHPLAESTPAPRPTDRQFQHVARRLSRFVGDSSMSSLASPIFPPSSPPPLPQQLTGQSLHAQMTGQSMLSDYSSRVVTDLKTQFDEVQNLRRDLGIMRQLYTEFMKTTKESLGSLRGQAQSVKQLAQTNVGGAREYIDTGKKKLDVRSQNVLTEVEKLQDTVESLKDDVLKRHITPKAQYLKTIKKDVDSVASELESLKEHINTIKPMWKKTWEEELQNIVDEQGFLTHQEQFLTDLLEDHKAVVEVYGHVEKIIGIRTAPGSAGSRSGKNRGFKPPPMDEGHTGLSTVLMEIRGAAVDPEKRLKAIEASQKTREKEMASRSDEMQAELSEFVEGKKLRMTGGAEEAERVRQRRNDVTLKAMFTGGTTDTLSVPPDSPLSP